MFKKIIAAAILASMTNIANAEKSKDKTYVVPGKTAQYCYMIVSSARVLSLNISADLEENKKLAILMVQKGIPKDDAVSIVTKAIMIKSMGASDLDLFTECLKEKSNKI